MTFLLEENKKAEEILSIVTQGKRCELFKIVGDSITKMYMLVCLRYLHENKKFNKNNEIHCYNSRNKRKILLLLQTM